ncbi:MULTISPECIES: non-homologous end-joining DNA ligase [unclassified Paenibacillus]|uniref:non-homologous end-joining DNA ligase n=1 Tax=unclassified Paenibacillus TaxID=185978 RepID=UPI001AE7891C|nr:MULTISPECIES: non-homologous end-joining DNA ligase [unclassified Paenibacillus]MBP1153839.1 bifunctional non-homologous end joining protein LigD [Paenibacillus sp. PvP091]MBP1170776.1 bifunctional non-homologous end joining protein LigD [Paenibacillus sp. PvR098]MBP2441804.1 bifunctional non-homologous end joining protein LigD [Paenibacillus sp. PvP052]
MPVTSKHQRTKGTLVVEGHELTITNPDKPLWPEKGITKAMYLEKLVQLSPYLLTYCRNRYLTTIRFPHGWNDKSFYQKNAPEPTPDFVKTAALESIHYVHLDSLPTLLWLGNLAALEFHPSFHRIGETLPAEWLIDIDPSVDPEPRIMEAAEIIGDILHGMNIKSVPKTSGATGVQIYVPIPPERGYTFEELRSIGQFVASYAVQKHPKLFTVERLKKDRDTLIYIDYLQHWYGKTLSAPYTPRARKDATVSTPLTWEEVTLRCDPRDFHLLNIIERLQHKGDLIAQLPPQNLDHVLSFIRK